MISFKRSIILLSIIFTFLISINHSSGKCMTEIKALKDKLLKGYDKVIRPTAKGSNTTVVITRLYPRQVIEVDEERSLFKLDSYYAMIWYDTRLQWNQTVDCDSKRFPLPPALLWLPEISAFNSHSLSMSPTRAEHQDVLLYVRPSGKVVWVPPIFTQTSCENIMESTYPYDEVECKLELGTWVHDGWEVDYANGYLYWDTFENIHPRWEVIVSNSKLVHKRIIYGDNSSIYASQNFYFSLKRRPLPEIEITRNMCILIMLLTLSIFWLPPDSSTKLHLLGIQILLLIALLVYVACNTKYPLGILAAVSFLQSTMYIVVAAFLLQILVISNLCSLTGPMRPPAIAMQLLTGPLGKYACLHWPFRMDSIQLYRFGVMAEDSPKTKTSPSPKDDWLLFAAGLDKLFFLLVSVAMVAIHNI